jgi:hypothetical protein
MSKSNKARFTDFLSDESFEEVDGENLTYVSWNQSKKNALDPKHQPIEYAQSADEYPSLNIHPYSGSTSLDALPDTSPYISAKETNQNIGLLDGFTPTPITPQKKTI